MDLVFHTHTRHKKTFKMNRLRLNQDPVYFSCIKMIDTLVTSLLTFATEHKEAIRGINFQWIYKYEYISESYHTQSFSLDEATEFISLIETNCNAYVDKLETPESIESFKKIIKDINEYRDQLNSYYM